MPDLSLPSPPLPTGQNWKLVVAYDGTDFKGWQVQPGCVTVQGELARVVHEITGENVLPQGSGRTDTGVHAEGQVVSLTLQAPVPPERLRRVLNRRLPASIRVMEAEHAGPEFHARGGVLSKVYEYRIFPRRPLNGMEERTCPPWLARFVWDCRWPLDLAAMQQAAPAVIGTHDFTSFAAHDPDRAERQQAGTERDNVRTIFSSEWFRQDGLFCYRVCGSGFLHHMVRNLVGTFVEIGTGRRSGAKLASVLAQRDRRMAGFTAPPQGLFLKEVTYRVSNAALKDHPTLAMQVAS